jgi:UDP-2,4-diacetamido-2,4,6-trideoxy-beta-L-altropyranose hydrolase
MRVVFRVDASITIGTGHIMRCRTLAAALKKRGVNIQFITRAHPGHLGDMLVRDGFAVSLLPQSPCIEKKGNDYEAWLGVSQQEDADQTIVALENQQCDWLIVDHYGLDRVWEAQLQAHTHKLMVIDDLANRPHECNVLLDQNYAVTGQERYQTWVPAHCQLLLGPRYALLRPEYAQYRETMVPRTGDLKRLLVFMGGADNANTTGKVLAALSTAQLAHLEVDVVIGPNFIHKTEVTEQANARPNTHIHGPRLHLADLMDKADLAVGAGGGTTWERLCMGLPSLVLSIAENQVPACVALASSGLIRYLGDAHKLDVAAIESALLEALAVAGQLHALAASYKALVDGRGADRVAEAINPTPSADLTVRPANVSDVLTYFAWVNDPLVRSSAINSEPIDMTTHFKWFDRRLFDVNTHLYVLEASCLPVGQVRFERHGAETTIDYSLDVLVRGRGWASQLLKLGIEVLNNSRPAILSATVKPENIASAATFIRLGFVEQEVERGNGNRHFQLLSLAPQEEESRLRTGVSNG